MYENNVIDVTNSVLKQKTLIETVTFIKVNEECTWIDVVEKWYQW